MPWNGWYASQPGLRLVTVVAQSAYCQIGFVFAESRADTVRSRASTTSKRGWQILRSVSQMSVLHQRRASGKHLFSPLQLRRIALRSTVVISVALKAAVLVATLFRQAVLDLARLGLLEVGPWGTRSRLRWLVMRHLLRHSHGCKVTKDRAVPLGIRNVSLGHRRGLEQAGFDLVREAALDISSVDLVNVPLLHGCAADCKEAVAVLLILLDRIKVPVDPQCFHVALVRLAKSILLTIRFYPSHFTGNTTEPKLGVQIAVDAREWRGEG